MPYCESSKDGGNLEKRQYKTRMTSSYNVACEAMFYSDLPPSSHLTLTSINQCNFNMQPINAMFVVDCYIIIFNFK
jgi:hypothetical protein